MERKLKTKRGQWEQENMDAAIYEVINNNMSENRAAKIYAVPRQTLRRHLSITRMGTGVKLSKYPGRKTALNSVQEQHFVNIILDIESKLFGTVTPSQLQSYVYAYCEFNNISHQFKTDIKMAGKDWLVGFMNRNAGLLRKLPSLEPESINLLADNLKLFYDTLRELLFDDDDSPKIPPDHIFSASKIEFETDVGQTVSIFCCVSATGCFVPPLFVFPAETTVSDLLDNAPTCSIGFYSDSGKITPEAYEYWFDCFTETIQPKSRLYPTLLILDGYNNYSKNFTVFLKADENNINTLSVPENCANKLLPLDVALMAKIRQLFNQNESKWRKENPNSILNEKNIIELFCIAYGKVASLENIYSGFQQTGIHPFDPKILTTKESFEKIDDPEYILTSVFEPICHLEN